MCLSSWFYVLVAINFAFDLSACSPSIDRNFIKRGEVTLDTFGTHKTNPDWHSADRFKNLTDSHHPGCNIDRNQLPRLSDLAECRNSSLFTLWRPKARMMGSRGWLNDPMSIYQTNNGSWHIGYQCQPNRLQWGNISQCSASTNDFTHFNDYRSWENPVTIAPSQLYDIRGVFDGTIIKDGWNGLPTLLYTSVFTGPLGSTSQPPEKEGTETQSLAYTENDGETWTKLNFGGGGNPVIYRWPEKNLSGFRDPFVFESSELEAYYSNPSIQRQLPDRPSDHVPTGKLFLTLSGGIRSESEPLNAGPRLFLYRQTNLGNLLDWTYLGPLISLPPVVTPVSPWRGASGINFECGSLAWIDEGGRDVGGGNATEKNPDQKHRLKMFMSGTEGGRNGSHNDYWPFWSAMTYDYTQPGGIKTQVDFSGVIDWGRAYAFFTFTAPKNRQILVGWSYEDDEHNVLTAQRGYQGAFTLFREIFVKVIRNVLPGSPDLNERDASWKVETESDGSKSVVTFGQRIVPETISAYKKASTISQLSPRTLDVGSSHDASNLPTNVVGFEHQPSDRFYAITAQLDFHGSAANLTNSVAVDRSSMVRGGFRVLASDQEWTDIYYDASSESLVVSRLHSSLIPSYGNTTEAGKLRLWSIRDPITNQTSLQSLNLTIIVDNSIVEVYANDQAVITTRVYPWLLNSTSVSFFVQASESSSTTPPIPIKAETDRTLAPNSSFLPHSVSFSNVELWSGLLNAWPNRPRDTSMPGTYSHNITSSLYGLWPDL